MHVFDYLTNGSIFCMSIWCNTNKTIIPRSSHLAALLVNELKLCLFMQALWVILMLSLVHVHIDSGTVDSDHMLAFVNGDK